MISFFKPVTDQLYVIFGEGNGIFPFCHSYLFDDGAVLILFDPQCGRKRLRLSLQQLGKTLVDVDYIFNSHYHFDHSASNAYIKKKSGAKLLIHEADRMALESFDDYIQRYGMIDKKLEAEWRKLLKDLGYREVIVDETFIDGAILPGEFQVIHTPGHAPGHCCFSKSGIIISGDFDLTSPWLGNLTCDVADYLKSIDKLLKHKISTLLPGHGLPAFKNIPERLEKFRERLLTKINDLYHLLPDKPALLEDITKLVFDSFSEKLQKQLRHRQAQFSFHFANISNFNYLKYLESQSKVKRILQDGQEFWQKTD